MAPITLPPRTMGAPPSVGRISPFRTVGTIAQNPPLATIGASSEFGFLKAAAAMALARDVSVLKKHEPARLVDDGHAHGRVQGLGLPLRGAQGLLRDLERHLDHEFLR